MCQVLSYPQNLGGWRPIANQIYVVGAVDRHLQSQGRMTLIESIADVQKKILLIPRKKNDLPASGPREALREILEHVEDIIKLDCRN